MKIRMRDVHANVVNQGENIYVGNRALVPADLEAAQAVVDELRRRVNEEQADPGREVHELVESTRATQKELDSPHPDRGRLVGRLKHLKDLASAATATASVVGAVDAVITTLTT
ncbi:hypothetical protein LWC35_27320 [Pseudonocardia kujensis]|uniref:hypothetical protein n=1 Tax=Pseudonocardia kujensis TaxID=1128675 RepID=UPI001E56DFA3|nr:hypothetical protein [Pseudonocardia kujensis]MCE0766588.1 hypothetical protein [Pseudonocardia kujensis]